MPFSGRYEKAIHRRTNERPLKEAGPQAIGRSRGGLTSKIHAVVDALGNPVRWLLTGGEVADITQAKALLDGLQATPSTGFVPTALSWSASAWK
jgi:hypothetical protein